MNSGKNFENAWKSSIPDYCLYYRLPDPPQSFNGFNDHHSSILRFSWKNPCDCFIFDGVSSILYTLELKSTKGSSMGFEDINITEKQPTKMIHKHQISALSDYASYKNVCPGFILNFRNEENVTEVTYFLHISNFNKMTDTIDKKSFNQKDLKKFGAIEIPGRKKRVNYIWDVSQLLEQGKKYV